MPISDTYKSGAEGAYGDSAINGSAIASGARTADGQGSAFATYAPLSGLALYIKVATATGTTPSLTVRLQDSPNGGADWYDVATATAMTAVGSQVLRVNLANIPASDYLRIAWVITGTTPSFTFKVDTYASRQG